MKIIALGDTHGRDKWKRIVNKHSFDKLIFIGDYWDSFDISFNKQSENFLDIIEFKKSNPRDVILLIGNHDYHYLPIVKHLLEECYSGYQHKTHYVISDLMEHHLQYMQMAYRYEDYLFTHAGVTNTWVRNTLKLPEDAIIEVPNIDEYINDVFKHKPTEFSFKGYNPYGDSKESSPIWVRPRSLMADAYGNYKQVVGHTQHERLTVIDDRFFFIDCMEKSKDFFELLNVEQNDERIVETDK